MSNDGLWKVRFLEVLHLVFGQGLAADVGRLVQPTQIAEPYDRDGPLLDDPGQGDLTHLPTLLVGDLHDSFDDGVVPVDLGEEGTLFGTFLASRARRPQRPGQETPVQGGPRDQAHTGLVTEGDHLSLFLSVTQTVVVLHGNELRPAMNLGGVLHLGELVSPHRTRP